MLDLGCGTGLNLPLVAAAVGPTGTVVGLDQSSDMLGMARARVERAGWTSVRLVRGDAAKAGVLVRPVLPANDPSVDVVLFTYSLAAMGDWQDAGGQALSLLRPGGRAAVVDTAFPTGRWRGLAPLAGLAMLAGGVHPGRQVWKQVASSTNLMCSRELRGGHVRVAVGQACGVERVTDL